MYYPNGSQPPSQTAPFQGYPQYAMMPRHMQQHRQPYVDPQLQQDQQQHLQQQQQQQQRSVMPSQAQSNSQFMQMRVSPMNQNFMGGYPAMPGGYQAFNYNPSPQRRHVGPLPLNDERCRKQLIVNYLAPDVATAELHELFSRFGPLDGARIICDRQTSLPKGYGFVYFCRPEDAKEAVDRMNGYEFHGKRLKVGYSTNPLNIVSSAPMHYPHGAIV
ncbi:putative RNA-binding protein 6 [Trypanosoma grayi]|uniref:putative RNA-binding protein 6 n=1 Tax=Trypanosoma grayi TaxID=71804 RepID=UPI0004F41A0F|nr:putative RNA-binding protein 6 [Trypanosoma grayi]KEG06687.1 putative RNA-binding protein 6 [Trypanosoma grayi]